MLQMDLKGVLISILLVALIALVIYLIVLINKLIYTVKNVNLIIDESEKAAVGVKQNVDEKFAIVKGKTDFIKGKAEVIKDKGAVVGSVAGKGFDAAVGLLGKVINK